MVLSMGCDIVKGRKQKQIKTGLVSPLCLDSKHQRQSICLGKRFVLADGAGAFNLSLVVPLLQRQSFTVGVCSSIKAIS